MVRVAAAALLSSASIVSYACLPMSFAVSCSRRTVFVAPIVLQNGGGTHKRREQYARTTLFASTGITPDDDQRSSKRKGAARSKVELKRAGSNKGRIKGKKAATRQKKAKRKQPTKKKTSPRSRDAINNIDKLSSEQREASPTNNEMYIQFSRVFQRHVVYKCATEEEATAANRKPNEVMASFEFLDEATTSFPTARVLAPKDLPFPPPSCSLVYPDDDESSNKNQLLVSRGRIIDSDVEEEECETTIAGMGLWTLCELEYDDHHDLNANQDKEYQYEQAQAALRTLLQLVSSESSFTVPRHFFRLHVRRFAMRGHTPESITLNHAKVVDLLSCRQQIGMSEGMTSNESIGLAMDPSDVAFVLQNFPQLSLYNHDELEELVRFLLQPLPDVGSFPSIALIADRGGGAGSSVSKVDWPSLADKGYGAGLTIDQATKAIKMMPELLALYYEDSRKPSIMYILDQARVPAKLIDEANVQLNLEGCDASDAFTFAYFNYLGISWSQLRILLASLPLWTTSHLEPGWELLQKGLIRSILKRPALDYLRQRLQIGPSDIYRLLKTHTRLSTYDSCNKIMPTLDQLQSGLNLSSSELRKLTLRMPSLMGMGTSTFEQRLDFFATECDMSIDELKAAVMKQPSLLQYGINSSLRPKLRFLLDELEIDESSISRIIKSAPAIMGLSLKENLRPKVVNLMKLCAFSPYEVGGIICTSPQILLLSWRSKIQPALRFLSSALMLSEPYELGQFMIKAPRVLHQGIETSLARKIEMLADITRGKSNTISSITLREGICKTAIEIIRKNPSLLVASNSVLEERIDRCPVDVDLATWLLPSNRGRKKLIHLMEEAVLASTSPDGSIDSVTKIYPTIGHVANDLDVTEVAVQKACEAYLSIAGSYFYYMSDPRLTTSPQEASKVINKSKVIPVNIFCSGGVFPVDKESIARGSSRTGGLAIQVFTDESHDRKQFFREFDAAATSCFGIRVPTEKENDSKLVAVFPLMKPSKNRCELFACSGSLRILEAFLKTKRTNKEDTFYDIKVYTDSNYAWKLVKSKQLLLELGSCFTAQEMMTHLDMQGYAANIDILHPLGRSFSRLNGKDEPRQSSHHTFHNAQVEFLHSMDSVTLDNGGLQYVKRLKRQAKSAAMWQFNRERNLV